MLLRRNYDLDVVPGGVPLFIHVSQYDSNEEIVLKLFASQGVLSVPSEGVTAVIRGTKTDGNGIENACTLSFEDDVPVVTVSITKQMTAAAGKTPFEIVLTAEDLGGEKYELPSATFYLIVKRAALDYETVDSDSDIMEIVDVMKKADQLIAAAVDIHEAAEEVKNGGFAGKEDLILLQNEVAVMQGDLSGMRTALNARVQGGYVSDNALYLVTDGSGSLGPFSGMGGGGGSGAVSDSALTVTNTTGWTSTTIAEGKECTLQFSWSSTEDGLSTGDGSLSISVNDVVKSNRNIVQGSVSVDVSEYLSSGTQSVKLTISDSTGNVKMRTFSVTVVSLYVTSSFDDSEVQSGTTVFAFIPYGNISKTMHFVVDGVEAGTMVTTVSGRQQSWVIPAQTHGDHTLEVYMTASINGQTVRSDSLFYDIIWITASNNAPVIAVSFSGGEVSQYSTVSIPYMVYTPGSQTSEVKIRVDGAVASEVTVGRTRQVFSARLNTQGQHSISFTTGNVVKTVAVTVTAVNIDVQAETEGLRLFLSSAGRSNNEEHPDFWSYQNISCTFSGFNWRSDGWIPDPDGIVAMKVTGNARLSIPYRMFETDFRSTGQTIEIDFSSADVRNYDAPILSCMSGGRGLVVTPQSCQMSSEQTILSMQYKEDEHVRVSFVIEKSSGLRRMYCYIDGILSGCIQYAADDDFSQTVPVTITAGSSEATINLYAIRVYGHDLNSEQITENWIADTQDGALLVERYMRNNIYDAYGSIVISQLPSDLPYMVIECAELPQYKGDKKTVSGRYVDPENPGKSFTFTGCEANVQGTSSQYYARKNYKLKFKEGFVMERDTVQKYQLTDDCIATKSFCMKADVASSEGANNVELVRLYNRACPYQTPAQRENPLVRQGIDGFPIVIFWYDTVNDATTFLGKYNFNLDKGTPECYGFVEGDESWEIRNNTSDRVLWKSDDYASTMDDGNGNLIPAWLNDFEARFPDTDPAYEDPAQLKEFASWIVSTDPEQATGHALPEAEVYDGIWYGTDTVAYRKAKFKAELGDYVELDSALFYYLFTELFLMVDSRAKNMFPSFIGSSIQEES